MGSPRSYQQLFYGSTPSLNELGRNRVLRVTNPDPSVRSSASSSSASLLNPQPYSGGNIPWWEKALPKTPGLQTTVEEGGSQEDEQDSPLPKPPHLPEQSTRSPGDHPILKDFAPCRHLDGDESRYPNFATQPRYRNVSEQELENNPEKRIADSETPSKQEFHRKKKLMQRQSKPPQLPDLNFPQASFMLSETSSKSRTPDVEARVLRYLNRLSDPTNRFSNHVAARAVTTVQKIKRKSVPVPFRPSNPRTPFNLGNLHPKLVPGIKHESPLDYVEVSVLASPFQKDPSRKELCANLVSSIELPYKIRYARRDLFLEMGEIKWLARKEEARILTEKLARVVASLGGSLEVKV